MLATATRISSTLANRRFTAGSLTPALEFDKHRVVLNEARLILDGDVVDSEKIFCGDKELTATAADGTEIVVSVDSGMMGELTRAQLRRADGSWIDLTERDA